MTDIKYIFAKHKDHLNYSDLNRVFGDKGMTFDSEKVARKYRDGLKKGGYLTRLINYRRDDCDYELGKLGRAMEGAVPSVVGWLVTAK